MVGGLGPEHAADVIAYGEAYARGIPGAKLITIERCGHLPPLEQPDRFIDSVEAFLLCEPQGVAGLGSPPPEASLRSGSA